jgi:hypothetical protein
MRARSISAYLNGYPPHHAHQDDAEDENHSNCLRWLWMKFPPLLFVQKEEDEEHKP